MSIQGILHRYRPVPTWTGGGFIVSTSDTTSYQTNAFNPAIDDLLLLFVVAPGTVDAGTATSSSGMTFTRITSVAYNSGADTIYIFISDSLVTSTASMTTTFQCTDDAATGAEVVILRISGMAKTGSAAALQTASSTGASGTPSATFGATTNTNNPTLGLIGSGSNPPSLTPPTGWTELTDSGFNTPATGMEYVFRATGFSGTTITWGNSSSVPYGVIILELDWS